jgi:hypothetical protein
VDDNWLGDVHSGGRSGNYRGSKEFVYNSYHGFQRKVRFVNFVSMVTMVTINRMRQYVG